MAGDLLQCRAGHAFLLKHLERRLPQFLAANRTDFREFHAHARPCCLTIDNSSAKINC